MTKKPTEIYEAFDVVSVPFPFTGSGQQKRRPALVLSGADAFNDRIGHSVMAMITSAKNAPWPLDVNLANLEQAGLAAPSVVRMKLFTLDHRFVVAKIGSLSVGDQKAVRQVLGKLLKGL